MYRAQRSSSNGAKEQLQQGAKEQQKGANRSSSFYSATNRFVIIFSATNRFRTVRLFHLNGWDVSYNRKGRFVFVSFRKNGTITLYCHISYQVVVLLLQLPLSSCVVRKARTSYTSLHNTYRHHLSRHHYCRCDSHCNGHVHVMLGLRWWYKTWSVIDKTWCHYRRGCHFQGSVTRA